MDAVAWPRPSPKDSFAGRMRPREIGHRFVSRRAGDAAVTASPTVVGLLNRPRAHGRLSHPPAPGLDHAKASGYRRHAESATGPGPSPKDSFAGRMRPREIGHRFVSRRAGDAAVTASPTVVGLLNRPRAHGRLSHPPAPGLDHAMAPHAGGSRPERRGTSELPSNRRASSNQLCSNARSSNDRPWTMPYDRCDSCIKRRLGAVGMRTAPLGRGLRPGIPSRIQCVHG
jgi:hypothetical protein